MKYASFGTISHGTLRTEDLLARFADELEYQIGRNADEWCSDAGRVERDRLLKIVGDARELDPDSDAASEMVNETMLDALQLFAAPYSYFGAIDGDGSDFGFWPALDSIEELPKFNDLAEVPAGLEEDYCVVNDHGNVSVYGQDGVLIWDCV